MRLLFAVALVIVLVFILGDGGEAWKRRRGRRRAPPPPQHCLVSGWTNWGGCSRPCGGGHSVRTRHITRHPAHGGNGCPGLREVRTCSSHPCPVSCLVSGWTNWGACSRSCAGGQSIRTRHVTRHPAHGGNACPTLRQTRSCSTQPCPVPCLVSAWTLWSGCTKTCGGGQLIRSRAITRNPSHGAASCPALRQTRACYTQKCPVPISCKWSAWSAWSSCDPCFPGGRSRARNVTVPAMFKGAQCYGSRAISDYSCSTNKVCKVKTCQRNKFTCSDGLSCIPKRLRCNGDNDCTDYSDEIDCPKVRSPCGRRKFNGIPNIDIAGAGFDITKLQEEGLIMDNEQYNGRCPTVKSGDLGKRFRKPANVQFYRFQVRVDSSFTTKSFKSSMDYFQDERSSYARKLDVSASFSYADASSLSARASGSNSAKTRMVIEFGTNTDSKFFKISSSVQVAQFRMVRRKVFLSYEFLQRVKELPKDFDYTKYSQVISDFGTHFYSRGTLGGKYEFVYRYSKKDLRHSGLTDDEQRSCLEQEATILLGYGKKNGKCSTNALSQKHKGSFTRSATNVISNVIGGTSSKAAALSFFSKRKPNKSDYNKWVDTVKYNPVVIDYLLAPISSAVPLSSYNKRKNMERALVLYLKAYDYSKCKGKCAHGAAVVVVNHGKLCKCLCPANYGGIDCNVRA